MGEKHSIAGRGVSEHTGSPPPIFAAGEIAGVVFAVPAVTVLPVLIDFFRARPRTRG